ncbi:hypothetical protein L7F22_030385 [Adiantum nelumboides]|nr:hypothetical protein [Adiantum nelumboides]
MTKLLEDQKQPAGLRQWMTLLLSSFLAKLQGMVRAFLVWVISAGPMPTHIAFIMDGNRRFADRLHVDRHMGHSHGYDALLRILKDCLDLHVKIVTLYAFSIDNFQRSPVEVSVLMDLMRSKLETLIAKQGLASEYGIRVQVLGDLHLLPEAVRVVSEKAMAVTRHNSSLVLNLCVSYTSTHEMVHSIQQTCEKFWAALCDRCRHPSLNKVNSGANKACKYCLLNGDIVFVKGVRLTDDYNEEHVNENGFSTCGEKKEAESAMSGRGTRCFSAPAIDEAYCIGLRNRTQTKAGVLDNNQLFEALCSSDLCLLTDRYANDAGGNMKRANSASVKDERVVREDVFWDLDHGSNGCEVMDPYLGPSLSCSVNDSASTNCQCCLSQSGSCEKLADIDSLSSCDSGKPCCSNDRIFKVVNNFVSEEEIEKNLYTYPCPPPDLLIRTSGETRLSNFLLWQTSFSHLAFCKVLWPEFSFRHLFFSILEYQRAFPSLLKKKQDYDSEPWLRHHYLSF